MVDPLITITENHVSTGKGYNNKYVSLEAVKDILEKKSPDDSKVSSHIEDFLLDDIAYTDFTNYYRVSSINTDIVNNPLIVDRRDVKTIMKFHGVATGSIESILEEL